MKESKVKWTPKRPEPTKGGDEWLLWFYQDYMDRRMDKEYCEALRREYEDARAWEEFRDSPTFYVLLVAIFTLIASVGFSMSYYACH